MDQNTINSQFSKVILSLGYAPEELKSLLKAFDLSKKIQTITSTYTLLQRKQQISTCLDELKCRNSLLYLLFLKNTLETMFQLNDHSKEEIWKHFINLDGVEILWNGFGSNNSDFLNNLVELVISLVNRKKSEESDDNEPHIFLNSNEILIDNFLLRILQKYTLINNKLILNFINLKINKVYLLLTVKELCNDNNEITQNYLRDSLLRKIRSSTYRCYCDTFLQNIVDDILINGTIEDGSEFCDMIGPEIKFLLGKEFELFKLFTVEQFIELEKRFLDKELYNQILEKLKKELNTSINKVLNNNLKNKDDKLMDNNFNDLYSNKSLYKANNAQVTFMTSENTLEKKFKNLSIDEKQVSIKPKGRGLFKSTLKNEDRLVNVSNNEHALDQILDNSSNLNTIKPKGRGLFKNILKNENRLDNVSNNEHGLDQILDNNSNTNTIKPKGRGLFKNTFKNENNKDEISNTLNLQQENVQQIKPKGKGLFNKSKSTEEVTSVSDITFTENLMKPKGKGLFGKLLTNVNSNGSNIIKSNKLNNKDANTIENSSTNVHNDSEMTKKSTFSFGARGKSFKQTLTSDKSYQPVKWKKTNKSKGKIFDKINYETIEKKFDIKEFDVLVVEKQKDNEKNKEFNFKATQEVQVNSLDPKKSYALNIALGRVKLSNKELIDSILKGIFENENIVKQLILYFPTHEEFKDVCNLEDSYKFIGRAELLFKEVFSSNMQINSLDIFFNALLSLRFKLYLKNRDYLDLIVNISTFLERILKSSELINLFGILLVIGNVLNSNTFNGNAEGFNLDSLNKFMNPEIIKIIKSKINIDGLIFQLFGKYKPEKIEFNTTGISIETLIVEIDEARTLFGEYVDDKLALKFKEIEAKFEDLNKIYKELQEYFGEINDGFIHKIEEFLKFIVN